MKNSDKATKRPWKLILPVVEEEGEETEEGGMVGIIMGDRIDSPGNFTVGNEIVLDSNCCPGDNEVAEANAKLIVKSVNHHEQLVEALRSIIEIGKRDMSNTKYDGYFINAKQVLSKLDKES